MPTRRAQYRGPFTGPKVWGVSDHLEIVRRLALYVRRSAESHASALARRNAAMLAASDAGHRNAAIARAAELSEPGTLEIITNAAAARSSANETGGS
jgi:hypothetical protein